MRCHICDKALTEAEIQINPDKKFECCSICLEVALDAAYCDGFVPPDEYSEKVSTKYAPEPLLDADALRDDFVVEPLLVYE